MEPFFLFLISLFIIGSIYFFFKAENLLKENEDKNHLAIKYVINRETLFGLGA